MSIGRAVASLVSGANDNTFALVNLNFDFALERVEAPREFTKLGLSLTQKRRSLAEDGIVHQTARRLGQLFEGIAPHTPHLIRAYGCRASEISEGTANNDLSKHSGAFAESAGVDGTSIWAAATSGKSAITVHLLACMLSRAWSGPKATSIWAEIVTERSRELKQQIRDGVYNSSAHMSVSAAGSISRQDLSQWDSSTRAWLQVADDHQVCRQKQLMLIVNNINLPVNQGNAELSTYSRVIEAWLTALEALEKLLSGQSQRISKGSVLLGLASWHIYPDLLVLSEKNPTIEFDDPVTKEAGRFTIAIQDPDTFKDEGVYWSLSLSHLKFYGDPVRVTSFTAQDGSRLNIDEFHLLVLGSILSDWRSLCPIDYRLAAQFFVALDNCLHRAKNTQADYLEGGPPSYSSDNAWAALPPRGYIENDTRFIGELQWIHWVGNASRNFLRLKDTEKSIASSIIALGQRRGRNLLSSTKARAPPMMGLCYPWIQRLLSLNPLKTGLDNKIEMMRYYAEKLGLRHDQCIIRIRYPDGGEHYVTAIPHQELDDAGNMIAETHVNWITTYLEQTCSCRETGHSCHSARCPCMQRRVRCTVACHSENVPRQDSCSGCRRDSNLFDSPEELLGCDNLEVGLSYTYVRPNRRRPLNPQEVANLPDLGIGPAISGIPTTSPSTTKSQNYPSLPFGIRIASKSEIALEEICTCCLQGHRNRDPIFMMIAGSQSDVGLFLRTDNISRKTKQQIHDSRMSAIREPLRSVEEIICALDDETICGHGLERYLMSFYDNPVLLVPAFRKDLHPKSFDMGPYLKSLHAVSLATMTYQQPAGSTISLHLLSSSLHEAAWPPPLGSMKLSRQQKFSCIAMFESGSYNICPGDLDDVIAISSRNSIFVSSLLLEDPYSLDHVDNVRRVVGNVGKSGMVLMVAPQSPRIKEVGLEQFRLVTHAPFDGKSEDSFRSTSLHLRFTDFEMPFNVGDRGAIDKDLRLVETLIQVFERDQWVADLDILPLFRGHSDLVRWSTIECKGCSKGRNLPTWLLAVDHWEELLDVPLDLGKNKVGTFRAYENWLARLAAACVCLQKGFRIVIQPPSNVCWHCSCRKKWGWSSKTLLSSNKAVQPREDLSAAEEQEEYESETEFEELEDSMDSPTSDMDSSEQEMATSEKNQTRKPKIHFVQPSNKRPSVEIPRIDPQKELESLRKARGGISLREVFEDAGYESDDTAVLCFDADDEENISVLHLPQIFIW